MNLFEAKRYKNMYHDNELFHVIICDQEFIFRNINSMEYSDAQELALDEKELQEIVCSIALVYPEEYDFHTSPYAGISEEMYPVIVKHSDFEGQSIVKRYTKHKLELNSFNEQAMAMVKAAMPEYTYDTMETWPLSKLIKEAVRAEYILKEIKGHNIEWKINTGIAEAEEEKKEDTLREICYKLISNGIDPILQLWPMFKLNEKEIDRPLIGGFHWKDEVISNAITKQIHRYRGSY